MLNKKQRGWLIGGLTGVLCLALLAFYLHFAFTHESTDDAFVDAHISFISARVAGQVTHVYVDDNQWVKQGNALLEIDPPQYKAKLDQARAQLLSQPKPVPVGRIWTWRATKSWPGRTMSPGSRWMWPKPMPTRREPTCCCNRRR